MQTKTTKTPLMMAESDALSYWPVTIVPESKLSHMATAHYGFVPKLSHHGGKTQKTIHSVLYVPYNENGFLCFSSDDVFSCRATGDDGRACAGACSQAKSHVVITIARSAKTSAEGFFRFLLTSET